ncbi:sugar transporter [Kineobactrum sediminis]|uniref:Sugar transporter n=1 Tax=Kineobactrum sediminis TaxID=1905677 RepID=A0A2N5XZA5_9GAMM|nr:SLBB domain-containing protein [Kineobactrum sediminis]PLW81478.1 sugar transporter [Kineobactrum sediminis]
MNTAWQQGGSHPDQPRAHRRSWLAVCCLALWAAALPAMAQTLSPQMVEQFRNLPKSQQESLARQYGVDVDSVLSQLGNGGSATSPTLGQPIEELVPSKPATDKAVAPQRPSDPDGKTERYGRALFDQEVSTFAPTDDAPVPGTYRLGVGDQLMVQLFGTENAEYQLQIGRNGEVNFPKLGTITLSGLTFEDARELIQTRVQQQLIGVESVVSMGRLRAIGIFMAGEVSVPGAFSVSALTTITQALFQAGGVTDIGTLRNIQVKRSGVTVATFDTYDLLLRGDASKDIRLQAGDVVFVPPFDGLVEVQGEVKRPMLYELAGSETMADVLRMAGGLTREAYAAAAILRRQSATGGLVDAITLDLGKPATLARKAVPGDVLLVKESGDALANSVELRGAVYRPGNYGWREGLRVSDLLGDVARDTLPFVDLEYALIVRIINARQDIDILQFQPGQAISESGSAADPLLQARDQVLIFSLPELADIAGDVDRGYQQISTDSEDLLPAGDREESEESSRPGVLESSREVLLQPVVRKLRAQARDMEPVSLVSVSGAVKAPGTYPLVNSTTVAQLVRAAGGLKDSAFLGFAELRTLTEMDGGNIQARYREIDLVTALVEASSPGLKSRDHLTVREIPDWSPTDSINISGEVVFPGEYLIQPGETLSDVIARAGGIASEGFLEGAVFTREIVAEQETARAREFAESIQRSVASSLLTQEQNTTSLAEVQEITDQLRNFEGKGRMLIDLPVALAGDTTADINVTDGDALHIPRRTSTVTVIGEVRRQGTHNLKRNLSLQDYLSLSAGLTNRADSQEIYIVKANGEVRNPQRQLWRFASQGTALEAGDTIVVPVDSTYKESLAVWRDVTQIIYQGLVSIAAVARL